MASRIHQIQQSPLIIHQAVTLSCGSCPVLSSAESIGSIVLLLEPMPFSELILPLDDDADHQTKYKKR
jgi:hypothetical protein